MTVTAIAKVKIRETDLEKLIKVIGKKLSHLDGHFRISQDKCSKIIKDNLQDGKQK